MMKKYINKHETDLKHGKDSFFNRLLIRARLAFLYLSFAFHRSFHLIFSRPTKSFALVNNQDEHGTWRASFIDHLHYKAKARAFSFSSFLVIITSLAVVYSTLHLTLPNGGNVQPVYAAAVQRTVTNINDAGPGSLRAAISYLNANVGPGDTGILHLDAAGIINLSNGLPPFDQKIQIVNDRIEASITIDGSALGAGSPCMNIRANESRVQSLVFTDCPVGIRVSNNASDVDVGAAGEAGNIFMHGTFEKGIELTGGTSGIKVRNILLGIKPGGGAVNDIAMAIDVHESSSNNVIFESTIGNVNRGIGIRGDNNELFDLYIGTNPANAVLPIAEWAIDVIGDNNIIGGDGVTKSKITIKNQQGVGMAAFRIRENADSNQIRALDILNSEGGILLHTATNTQVGSIGLSVGPTIQNTTRAGIAIDQANDTTVAFGNIRNSTANGISVQNTTNFNIVNSTIADNIQSGVRYQNSSGDITGCSIVSNAGEGIIAMQSEIVIGDLAAAQNTITSNGKVGIILQDVTGMSQVENNAITDNAWTGLEMRGNTFTIEVNSNTITNNGTSTEEVLKHGIFVKDSNNGVIDGNTISGNHQQGIALNNATSWSVNDNVITDNSVIGVRIENGSSSNVLTANYIGLDKSGVISGNNNGIVVAETTTGTTIGGLDLADANIIGGNTLAGVVINSTAAASNQVTGNYIGALADGTPKGNLGDGVIIAANSQTVNQNNIANNGASGLILDSCNDVTVYDNVITNNTLDGVRASAGGGHAFRGNTVSNNDGDGVAVVNSADSITIGGTLAQGNDITGNGRNGIFMGDGSNFIIVIHNTINNHPNGLAISMANALVNEGVAAPIMIIVNDSSIRGTGAVASGDVHVYKNGVPYGSTTADSNGNWQISSFYTTSLQGHRAITAGDKFTAATTNGNGSTSRFSLFGGAIELALEATVAPLTAGVTADHTYEVSFSNRAIGYGETPQLFFVNDENVVQDFDYSGLTYNADESTLPVGTTVAAASDGKSAILDIPINLAPGTYTIKLEDVGNVDAAGSYEAVFTLLTRDQFTNKYGGDLVSLTTDTLLICPAAKTLGTGETYDFKAYYANSSNPISCGTGNTCSGDDCTDVTDAAEWLSDDTDVATIVTAGDNKGRVTTLSEGDAVISINYNSLSANADLTVSDSGVIGEVIVCPAVKSIDEGAFYDAEAYYTADKDKLSIACGSGTDCVGDGCTNITQGATWSSDNTNIATVINSGDNKGRITGVDVGSTDVSATYLGLSDEMVVTIAEGPPPPTVPIGYFDYTYINGERVYDNKETIYLGPNVNPDIKITNANNTHDVRITVKGTDDAVVEQGGWKKVQNAKVEETFTETESETQYNAFAKARLSNNTEVTSAQRKIASLQKTRRAPIVNTLQGDYTVLMCVNDMQFGIELADGETGKVEWQNALTGEIVVSCTAPAIEGGGLSACALPFVPPVGEYNVKQYTLDGSRSASNKTYVVLTPTAPTTVINTDIRNQNYYNRDVVANNIKVVGIAPEGAEVEILLDGESQGVATFKTNVGWEKELDLSGKSRGQAHMIKVKVKRNDNVIQEPQRVPIFLSNPPVELIVPAGGEHYVRQDIAITIQGGASDNLYVKNSSGELVFHDIFPQDGLLQVPLDTTKTGSFTWSAYGERNRTGLRTTSKNITFTIKDYEVATTSGDDDTSADDTDDADDDDSVVDDDTDDDTTPADDVADDDTTPADDTTPTDDADDADDDDSVVDDDVVKKERVLKDEGPLGDTYKDKYDLDDDQDVPAEYKIPVATQEEADEIKEKLAEDIKDVQEQDALVVIDEETGAQQAISKDDDGRYEVQRHVLVGLPSMKFLQSYFVKEDMDYVALSGKTEPYAKVAVTVMSDPLVQIARADDTGEWTMKVPTEMLEAGQHTAYLQTKSRGVTSDQTEIARFVVVEEQRLSNTTWVFIINIGIAVLVLLTVFGLQITKRGSLSKKQKQDKTEKKDEEAVLADKITIAPTPSESDTTEESSDDQDKSDNEPPSHHSALGV